MPSPIRRSTRGAIPTKPAAPTSNSSSSSLSSARQDRNAKPNSGHRKSATPHSLSSEETSEAPRRSQRSHPAKEDAKEEDNADDIAAAEEEEITRCICGHQEYPGPPLSEAFSGADAQSEDAGGLFIQCDGCSVWQHGGCVGIVEESQSPDKYYCEDCRPKLHDQHTDTRGQKYSLYTPLHPKSARKDSDSKNDEKAKKEREATVSRASADPVTGRRRATMRSKEHDDEEEQLRIALEESKREAEPAGNGKRNGKRSRDDSEELRQETKRQRTVSESITSMSRTATVDDESDEETTTASRAKKARAEAVQSVRQAELREKEKERDRARAEAASRRQDRAGRRRGDEFDPAEETPKPINSAMNSPPPSSLPPSPPTFTVPEKAPLKKGPVKRTKKLGNNQYTKNRDFSNVAPTSSPHSKKRQLANQGMDSGDEQLPNGDAHIANKQSPVRENGIVKAVGKFGKGKNKAAVNGATPAAQQPREKSIPEMERLLDGMAMFMQRAQIDMAGDKTPPGSGALGVNAGHAALAGLNGGAVLSPGRDRPFVELSSMEMADELSRNIVRWKQLHGAGVA